MRVHNQVSVADRLVSNGEFQDSVEHQSPAAGTATVEAEYELVKLSLVGAEQPALGEPRYSVDAGEQPVGVLATQARSALAVTLAHVAVGFYPHVPLPGVGDYMASGSSLATTKGCRDPADASERTCIRQRP